MNRKPPQVFWRRRKREFPHLFQFAQQYLSPPVCSVEVERLLEDSGRLLFDASNGGTYAEEEWVRKAILLREFMRKGKDFFDFEAGTNLLESSLSSDDDMDSECMGFNNLFPSIVLIFYS